VGDVRKRYLWWESLGRALRKPRLRRVLGAYLGFIVCDHAHWIAILVWAYDLGGVRGAGAMAIAQLVPAMLLASPVAALLGRVPRTRALTLGYLAQAVTLVAVGAAITVGVSVPVVVAASVPMAVAITLTRPVHHATLPEISETTGDLTASNAASGTVEAAATLLGPLACALLIGHVGPGGVIVGAGAVAAVGATLTATLVREGRTPPGPTVPVLRVGETLRAVVADPAARTLVGLTAALYVLVGMIDILIVVLAIDLLGMGDSGPGVLTAMIGLGALLGASLTFVLVGRDRLAPLLVTAGVVTGASFAFAGAARSVTVAAALVALTGAGRLFFDVTTRTFEQRLLPDRLLVALFGVQEAVIMAGMAVGAVLAPLLVALLGARGAFAGAVLLPLLALLAWPRLRRYDASTAVPLDVLALLHRVPILTVLSPRVVERLASESVPLSVPAGRAVVTEGDEGDQFYVVAHGRLEVTHGSDVVRELGEGGWFGELALLRAVPRTATVTAVTDVSLYGLGRDAFLSAVAGVPRAVDLAADHARDHYR
jgi:hypothetical protein